jgi:hypothetical protein
MTIGDKKNAQKRVQKGMKMGNEQFSTQMKSKTLCLVFRKGSVMNTRIENLNFCLEGAVSVPVFSWIMKYVDFTIVVLVDLERFVFSIQWCHFRGTLSVRRKKGCHASKAFLRHIILDLFQKAKKDLKYGLFH